MKKLRAATEAEVIAQFLQNEFHHHDYDRDRDHFTQIVKHPDVGDEKQNALRRALFYRRRGHLWNEIPRDTAWSLVQLEETDLDRLCVFARTHWNKIAGGNCLLRHVVEQIRTRDFHGVRVLGGTAHGGVEISDVGRKVDSIRAFSQELRRRPDSSAVLLIGIDDEQPVTILEGNHRLTAALLVSPELLTKQFNIYFGASPNMARCCWHQTNLPNLLRYARNRLKNFGKRGAAVEGLAFPAAAYSEQALTDTASTGKAAAESD